VLVFGTGESVRLPPPELARTLESQGVGLEVSNTVRAELFKHKEETQNSMG
jgi:uncharacterized protein